jgi:hypothetical protein
MHVEIVAAMRLCHCFVSVFLYLPVKKGHLLAGIIGIDHKKLTAGYMDTILWHLRKNWFIDLRDDKKTNRN